MKKNIINFSITAGLFVLFAIFTILVKFVDTSIVVATNTEIGFSSINKPIFNILGTSDVWNTLSLALFIIAALVVLTLACVGIKEWITNKKISKVNHKILFLLGLYMLTAIFYLLFEIIPINYRPLLDDGIAKLSYPSSHTLLICVICLSASLIIPDYIRNKPLKITLTGVLITISILAPISRLLAGMHWFTDVIGSLILSVALVMCYYSAITAMQNKKNKKIKVVLFDLDGTLLPMDQDTFVKSYFGLLAKKLAPHGYEKNKLIESIWRGTNAMITNDGNKTNEDVFWCEFANIYGNQAKADIPYFDEYYQTDFDKVQSSCGYNDNSKLVIEEIKKQGYRIALATNPIFPSIATEKRIKWAGLNNSDFELYTTYENSHFCKPNTKYYLEILQKLNVNPEECLMVGNDVSEDMIAKTIGMKVFLITDCLINKENKDLSNIPHGNFDDLLNFIKQL